MAKVDPNLRIGIIGVVVSIFAIAISLFSMSFTFISPTDPNIRLIFGVIFSVLGIVMFGLGVWVTSKTKQYLRNSK